MTTANSAIKPPQVRITVLITSVLAIAPVVSSAKQHASKIQPDIAGIWAAPWKSDRLDPKYVVPDGPTPEYTDEYAPKQKKIKEVIEAAQSEGAGAHLADDPVVLGQVNCLPDGVPRMMIGGYSLEILKADDHFTIIGEFKSETRRIYLNKQHPPRDEIDPGYEGHSVAHWEGRTLVVDTVGIKESVLIPTGAQREDLIAHSDQLIVTERIKLVTPDILQNQITITDPAALKKPYSFTYTLLRRKGYETPEYVCDNPREHIDSSGKISLKVSAQQ